MSIAAFSQNPIKEINPDLKKYYDQYLVKGSFILFDQNKNKYIICNQQQVKEK